MADTRTEASINKCSLCFITLTCIVEEQFANSIMHDQNLTFKVRQDFFCEHITVYLLPLCSIQKTQNFKLYSFL